ncbi:UNVERIFIED_CONTAM: protein CANDIDATE G-PROTEIN COUPLED RECEPTOR 7 [Sesamum angustifolium]|uniref:Protein CANDIDATE G-PROTEIN COUPLED RECEPTOR 7 n=1 Tax=Sesamum angustifolium TaxID=2727405 RepID=A0AAW2MLB7_9LAMI
MSLPLVFLVLLSAALLAAGEIRFSEIRSDDRTIIPFDEFGFTHRGQLELNVTQLSLSGPAPRSSTLSKVGFFLCTRDAWIHVLQQIEDSEIKLRPRIRRCTEVFHLHSRVRQIAYRSSRSSMNVRSAMYNLEGGKSNRRDYLSIGKTVLPRVYFLFSLIYFILAAVWINILYKKRLTVFRIHFFMLAVVLLKTLNLLCEAEDKSYIKRTGSLTPYLQDKEKKVLMIVIPLQVVANIAQVVIDETGPYGQDWVTWKQVFLLVDVVCCCAVLFPIVWSIKNLREAARTDGKAAVNLMKLTLFRQYYIVVICYIYFTRVVVYALETITLYKYLWTSIVAGELATLAFYVFTGYKFKPEAHNPYFAVMMMTRRRLQPSN